jgi:hypothetical protein
MFAILASICGSIDFTGVPPADRRGKRMPWLGIIIVAAVSLMTIGAPAQRARAEDVCSQFEDDWRAPDRAAWTGICRNGVADVSRVQSGDDLSKLSPAERDKLTISPIFIKNILTKSPYREHVHARGVVIKGAIVARPLLLNDLAVEGPLSFLNCEFAEVIDLRRSHFSVSITLTGSSLVGGLVADESVIDGSLVLGATEERQPSMLPSPVTIGFIHAQGARIAGNLNIRVADITAAIDLTTVRTGGSINIMHVRGREAILAASDVRGQLVIVDSGFGSTVTTKRNAGAYYSLLNLNFVHVGQDAFLNRTIALDRVDLQGAAIGGGLSLVGGQFGTMNARGAAINGSLRVGFNQSQAVEQPTMNAWPSAELLDLTNATIGAISAQSILDYWPEKMVLTNFKIGGFDFNSGNVTGRTAEERTEWFKKWLGRQDAFLPYYYVRTVLAAAGDDETAADIGFAGRNKELCDSIRNWHVLNTFYLFFSLIMIGYGYCMWLPLVWMAGFISLGTIVFKRSREGQQQPALPFDALVYSIDTFFPLIEFRKRHQDIDITSGARFYFYGHKLIGWIVTSFIIAGLAGFTK